MIKRTTASTAAIVVCLGILFLLPTGAQPSIGPISQAPVSQHHQMIYQTMRDMTQQMSAMTDQMSHGELTPDQRKQMAGRMGLMSMMMRRLSGLAARPAIKHADLQRQVDEMRKKMDSMMADSKMNPSSK